ncbi:CPBP family intramembrane glutamic endopeptidase [Georgenia sp. Marseille-Q6866]
MSRTIKDTPPTPPSPRTAGPTAGPGRPGPWSTGWVRATALLVALVAGMVVTSSIASALDHPVVALLSGPLLAVLMLWLYRFLVGRVERRPVLELAPRGAARRVLTGLAGGLFLAAATIGALALLGAYQVTGWGSLSDALTVVGMMCAVAVAEEVVFRGVVLRLLEPRWGTWLALGGSSALFGLVHLVNPSASLWGATAIAVEAGLLLGAAYVATRSLWLPIGLHLGWNVTIVAVFGTVTSGAEAHGALVTAGTSGPTWLTGGDFGPEASVVAVLLCSAVTAVLLVLAHRRGRLVGRRS